MYPADLVNASGLLDDTPLGTLRVVFVGGRPLVCVVAGPDDDRVLAELRFLEEHENPLNAICGRRIGEESTAAYRERDHQRALTLEREDQEGRDDFRARLQRFLDTHGREAAELLGGA